MCQKVQKNVSFLSRKDRTIWGVGRKEKMWGTLILNEKENIYYLKTKPSHTKQIWTNITLDCLEDALWQ